jgi:hypothetical protein
LVDAAASSGSRVRLSAASASLASIFEQSLQQHAARKHRQQQPDQQGNAQASASSSSSSSAATMGAGDAAAAAGAAPLAVALGLGDETCHCLLVHPAQLAPDDEAKHKGVMNAEPDAMKELLVQWLPGLSAESIAVVLAIGRDAAARRLHVQFHSRDGLAAALKQCPVLIQCSALHPGPKSSWDHRAAYCGPPRHELPEKLELLCQPTDGAAHSAAELDASLPKLLQDMQLDVTSRWLPSSTYGGVAGAAGGPLSRVVVHALPRLVGLADLSALVQRINDAKHVLWGGIVKVSAPNIPSLARCKQCHVIGHTAATCPKYSGPAVRFIFRAAVPYSFLVKMQQAAHASYGYLGNDASREPHRKLTLVFSAHTLAERHPASGAKEAVVSHISPIIGMYAERMHEAPDFVNAQERHKECGQCASTQKNHLCPFGPKFVKGLLRAPATAASTPADRVSEERNPRVDNMCMSWRKTKSCPRLQRGDRCRFEHPAQHQVPDGAKAGRECFQFARSGRCNRPQCPFTHTQPEPASVAHMQERGTAPAHTHGATAQAPHATIDARRHNVAHAADTPPQEQPEAHAHDTDHDSAEEEKKHQGDSAPPSPAPAERTRPLASTPRVQRAAPTAPVSGTKRSRSTRNVRSRPALQHTPRSLRGPPWAGMSEDEDEQEDPNDAAGSGRAGAARPPPSSLSLLSSPQRHSQSPAEAMSSGSAAAPAAKKGRRAPASHSPAAAPPARRSLSAPFAAAASDSSRVPSKQPVAATRGSAAQQGSQQGEKQ